MTNATQLHFFAPSDGMPNSPLPLLFWGARAPISQDGGRDICRMFERHGWHGTWVSTVLPYWHFHTLGHEVLVCVSGRAKIHLGGDGGYTASVAAGDAMLIPAGVGHRRLEASHDFLVAGAYPEGQQGDIVRPGDLDDDEIERRLGQLALPKSDPLTGRADDIATFWKSDPASRHNH